MPELDKVALGNPLRTGIRQQLSHSLQSGRISLHSCVHLQQSHSPPRFEAPMDYELFILSCFEAIQSLSSLEREIS